MTKIQKYKDFQIKYSESYKEFYAVSKKTSQTFMEKDINKLKLKIDNCGLYHSERKGKSIFSRMVKELNKISKEELKTK